jgi:hypothetical protein
VKRPPRERGKRYSAVVMCGWEPNSPKIYLQKPFYVCISPLSFKRTARVLPNFFRREETGLKTQLKTCRRPRPELSREPEKTTTTTRKRDKQDTNTSKTTAEEKKTQTRQLGGVAGHILLLLVLLLCGYLELLDLFSDHVCHLVHHFYFLIKSASISFFPYVPPKINQSDRRTLIFASFPL